MTTLRTLIENCIQHHTPCPFWRTLKIWTWQTLELQVIRISRIIPRFVIILLVSVFLVCERKAIHYSHVQVTTCLKEHYCSFWFWLLKYLPYIYLFYSIFWIFLITNLFNIANTVLLILQEVTRLTYRTSVWTRQPVLLDSHRNSIVNLSLQLISSSRQLKTVLPVDWKVLPVYLGMYLISRYFWLLWASRIKTIMGPSSPGSGLRLASLETRSQERSQL